MAKNDFLAFATAATALVEDQASWETEPVVSDGFQDGIADAAKCNKAWRQAGFPGASVSEWVNQQLLTVPIPDDGDVQNWVDNFDAALRKVIGSIAKPKLTSALTVYVSPSGNDAHDGLTPATAFATIQRGVDYILYNFDSNGFACTVSVAAGTYAAGATVEAPLTGHGSLTITTTGGLVTINALGIGFFAIGGGVLNLQGNFLVNVAFETGAPNAVLCAEVAGRINIWGAPGQYFQFGTSQQHIYPAAGGYIGSSGGYIIAASANVHWYASQGATMLISPATITVAPGLTFGTFAIATEVAVIDCGGLTFTNSAVGTRYGVSGNSIINTGAGGESYLPGSTPGSKATGGQYY